MHKAKLSVSENILVHLAQLGASLGLHIRHSRLFSPRTQPDKIKKYSAQPHLGDNRIFLPTSLTQQPASTALLPLVISVHGSGWIVGNPSDDDTLNRYLADHTGAIVVGINYGKAPQHSFPQGLEDVKVLINAVLEDPELPIDHDRVIFVGGSAGANLILAAVQDQQVSGRAKGIVAICPPTNLVPSKDEKMGTRRRPDAKDALERFYDIILTTYLDERKNGPLQLDDPRLSPLFFKNRASFPAQMYLIGFEDDLLCREAEVMAEKLAGLDQESGVDEGKMARNERGWVVDGVTWEFIAGHGHGFAPPSGESPEQKHRREEEHEALYARIADWINRTAAA